MRKKLMKWVSQILNRAYLYCLKKKGRDWMWLGGGGGVDDVLHSCFMSRQRVSILRLKKRENTQTKTTTYLKKSFAHTK